MDHHDPLDPQVRQRLRDALEQAAADIDPATTTRLRQARLHAITAAGSGRRPRWQWLALGVPVAATAALVLLVTDLLPGSATAPALTTPPEAVRDLDLLTSGESLDLLENLDLIRWLPPAQRS